MVIAFFLLSLLAGALFCWGVIAPKKLSKFVPKIGKAKIHTRKQFGIIFGFLSLAFFVVSVASAQPQTQNNLASNKSGSSSNTSSNNYCYSAHCAGTSLGNNSQESAGSLNPPTTSTSTPYAVGDTINIDTLAVTLTKVIDPATGADQFTTPDAGNKFVAAEFSIKNTGTQTYHDDANNNVTVIDSSTQAHTSDVNSVSDCTNFNLGEYTLAPGDTESGCVVFQIPQNASVSKAQFLDNEGNGNGGEWTIQ